MATCNNITFEALSLQEPLLQALSDLGYHNPTAIQKKAIPVVLAGKDVLGAAQTGTGKTAGYALPILQALLPLSNKSMSPARHPVRALVLAPTRELADQIYQDILHYSKYTDIKSAVVFGGVDMNEQAVQLRSGVEILIATPGRLLDHAQQKQVYLGKTQVLVLDEADRMLDMGFLPDLKRIVQLLPSVRQNLLFSATFSTEIQTLAQSFLKNPIVIEVSPHNMAADTVEQTVFEVDEKDKGSLILYLLNRHRDESVLIFCNTKIGASRLSRYLTQKGKRSGVIHGDKTQVERMATLESFKSGELDVLVATDVAARGLHIEELPCVINYDLPHMSEDYVHRIGRTGRAGLSGIAYSLYSLNEQALLDSIERLIDNKIRKETIDAYELKGARRVKRFRQEDESTRPLPAGFVFHKIKDDDWFNKPYVPEASVASESAPVQKKTKRLSKPLAALLGGKK